MGFCLSRNLVGKLHRFDLYFFVLVIKSKTMLRNFEGKTNMVSQEGVKIELKQKIYHI